jgi:hypothetical protein
VATEDSEVSRARDGYPRQGESRVEFSGPIVQPIVEQQEIDFRRLEPRHHDVLAQIDQLGEFDPQRLFIPLSGFPGAIERDRK